MGSIEVVAVRQDEGLRLDTFVSKACGISRALSQKFIKDGNVLLNGGQPPKSQILAQGDLLNINIPMPKETSVLAQDIPLVIVYEDEHLLVVDKPKGMVVHPAAGNPSGTLVNALLWHCKGSLSGIGGELRPGIVHRIDKDTSGLLVAAKSDAAHVGLAQQFAEHSVKRVYNAVVYGHMAETAGTIDAPIGRSRADRKKMAVTARNSKSAITTYKVIAEYQGFTHLALRLKTGRTHQIRVHMADIGHPLAGDVVYGPQKAIRRLGGQCLHAGTLGFAHPISGETLDFCSRLPEYFTSFLEGLA